MQGLQTARMSTMYIWGVSPTIDVRSSMKQLAGLTLQYAEVDFLCNKYKSQTFYGQISLLYNHAATQHQCYACNTIGCHILHFYAKGRPRNQGG